MNTFQVDIMTVAGDRETCQIELSKRSHPTEMKVSCRRFGDLVFTGDNAFSALVEFRLRLEQDGYYLLCCAARKDAYPSGMCLDMGGGRAAYLLELGKSPEKKDLVNVFVPATIDQVGTVAEQRACFENWLESRGRVRTEEGLRPE